MADSTTRTPYRPSLKLRASCDECGSSKVKCDRSKPECGRCRSMGLRCVYGVSQKCAKALNLRQPNQLHTGSSSTTDVTKRSNSSDSMNSVHLNPVAHSQINTGSLQDTAMQSSMDHLGIDGMDGLEGIAGMDELDSFLNPFMQSQFDEWDFTNQFTGNPFTPPSSSVSSIKYPVSAAVPPLRDSHIPSMSQYGSSTSECHDCLREAYNVLGSLNLNRATSSSLPSSPAGLDQVLRLNRQACDSIRRYLACSCARSPQLALVAASIFARVLVWYQQAAVDMSSTKTNSTSTQQLSSPVWPSPGSSAGDPSYPGASSQFQSSGLEIAPTQIAVGSFQVDDHGIQTSLKIQLVLSEFKKIECLIDLFTSQSSNHHFSGDASPYGGVDSLYGNLASWLRGEHARISGALRSKLRKLN